ncbi:AcrR family transcriptional regulator [Curtobacterium luteum]|uniref:AcrR family transcriptional regulator n=1 Tax=Curtobacterium luteum TaxID=33881 RepID=A0A8H9GCQ0_9MICO|nr:MULTISPECIES: TetR/AcrR family transcriptional regulator [Curtobacterium]MBM7802683.1 AcrR family transcriptional regulator [Curtobacterium luteum]NUU49687.1 TetR/AcrR family transcriptional regulator [Curtobacterium luteum]GGL10591.1 hypothetical protein GCM10009769_30850 [Curtobacterium luteum]
MSQREEQRARTRRLIIEAAAREFARHGYAGTTFASIAAVLGKPKSAIPYDQFPSKHAIAAAVLDAHFDRLRAALDEVRATEAPGLDALLTALVAGARLDATSPIAHGAIRLLLEHHEEMAPARAADAVAFVRANVAAAVANGDVRTDVDGSVLTRRLLVGALGAHAAALYRLSRTPIEDTLCSSWAIVLRDVGVPATRVDEIIARATAAAPAQR